jgi:putative CocE/NonD family hydrolase
MDSRPRSVTLEWGLRIPLRDGIRLHATLYRPRELTGAAPAIVTLTPYIAQRYHEEGMYFASHGFAFLAADVRGRGNSEGEFEPNINEACDGHDVVEWIAAQPWCNGQVAMWGGSYGGHAQWATAKQQPAHLATIVPFASPCIGVDFPMRNNIASPYLMQWLTLVYGRALQDAIFWGDTQYWRDRFREFFESGAAFQTLDAALGCPSPIFQRWLSHPHQDAYWDRYNPTSAQYAQLTIPILTITGSYDGDQPGALAHHRRHVANAPDAPHYLVIGPWDHAGTRSPRREFAGIEVGPASLVDLRRLHLEWYDWTMRGGAKPAFLQGRVAYYVMGADEWRYAETLEQSCSRSEPWFLTSTTNAVDVFSSGTLTAQPAARGGTDHYLYDPGDCSLAALESMVDPEDRTDQRMVLARSGRQLLYHSAPLANDVEITGFFRLSAWIAIDQPDTDFRAAVYEVGLNGASVLLSEDWMRARYREGLREERLIRTTEPLPYEFEHFTFVSRLVRKGCRLRVVIGPIDSIYAQKNYNNGGVVSAATAREGRCVCVRLFHGPQHPSALHIPYGQPKR